MKKQTNKPATVTGTDEQGMFCVTRPKLKPADLLILFLLFLALFSNGQTTFTANGNTLTQTHAKTESKAVKTGKIFINSKGEKFDVYKSENGKLYVLRTSKKTGKEYKQYITEKN